MNILHHQHDCASVILDPKLRAARIAQLKTSRKIMRTLSGVGLLFIICSFFTDRNRPIAFTTTILVVQTIWINFLQTESNIRLLEMAEHLIDAFAQDAVRNIKGPVS